MRGGQWILTVILMSAPALEASETWKKIFDGRNLGFWKPNENPENWTVEDGALVGRGSRSHLYYMRGKVQDFELKAEVMISEAGNSGIYFHADFHKEGWFSDGHEVQINNTHKDPVKTGSLWAVVKLYTSPVRDKEWFRIHIRVKGQNIVVRLNEQIVVDYTEPKCGCSEDIRRLGSGYIVLQQHDPGGTVRFRNILLKE